MAVVKGIANGVGGLWFVSRAGQIDVVSPTARHRRDVFWKLCCLGVKLRKLARYSILSTM